MQAMILAAGMGRRLKNYTKNNTKCMVEVAGKTIIERMLSSLKKAGITKLIIVTGYCGQRLKEYLEESGKDFSITFIDNSEYESSNNIYSIYLARNELIKDDTILLESDLVFDEKLIRGLLESSEKNLATVAKYEHWMDGTVVRINSQSQITEFIEKKDFLFENADDYYKTVNIYKFSKEFSEREYVPFLEAYIKAYGTNEYYEQVLSIITKPFNSRLYAYILKNESWYEIDDEQDLNIANTIFAEKNCKFHAYDGQYGGFWRFPKLRDYCYLVNPYYPPGKMVEQMKYFYETLLRDYPSGSKTQEMNAARMFGIGSEYTVVGNGSAELIQALGRVVVGTMLVSIPAFNEYIRCFRDCNMHYIESEKYNFAVPVSEYKKQGRDADIITIISPDNPSGYMLSKEETIELLDYCKANDKTCIIDESFSDFAEESIKYSLLSDDILKTYPNLVVLKSISKSYGVPGIRLGILATSNEALRIKIKNELPIWNINSLGEYFLQIQDKYKDSYLAACQQIANRRKEMMDALLKCKYIKVYESQANYIMCYLTGTMTAEDLCNVLMDECGLLIKDLSTKDGIKGKNYIRLAVKDKEENAILIQALNKYLK